MQSVTTSPDLPYGDRLYVIQFRRLVCCRCPDRADDRQKDQYMASRARLRSSLAGLSLETFAAVPDDIEYKDILSQLCPS